MPFFDPSMPWWQRIGTLILVVGVMFGMFWSLTYLALEVFHYVQRWIAG